MELSNLVVLDKIRVLPRGSEIYANFDLGLAEVRLLGCSLVRHRNGSLTAYGPTSGIRGVATVTLQEPRRSEVANAAADMYLAATGVDLRAGGIPYAA